MKRIFCILLAAAVLMTAFPQVVFALPQGTVKEEVVYAGLEPDGTVREVSVVNVFDVGEDGRIVDYGPYSEVRNMTTTDGLHFADGTISVQTTADKLYYEGKLETCQLPWTISVRYFLDGAEYPASDIAGKSGRLEIRLSVRENKAANERFFAGYALQISMTLDGARCDNITASGATVANVGQNKQLSFILLSGREKEWRITADVTDFEMDGISLNGVKMDVDIDLNEQTVGESVKPIQQAATRLDEGAETVADGAAELQSAADTLAEGAGTLQSGFMPLTDGAASLTAGLETLSGRSGTLNAAAQSAFEGLCAAAQSALNASLPEPVTLTPDNYASVLNGLLAQLGADDVYTQAYESAKAEVTAAVNEQAEALYRAYLLTRAAEIYQAAATEGVLSALLAQGYTAETAQAFLATEEGRAMVAQAAAALTDAQKEQALAAAQAAMTDEQKAAIRAGYIAEQMASDKVTAQIERAVESVHAAAGEVSRLKGQLDGYALFRDGLKAYTDGVDSAATGAKELAAGVRQAASGAAALADGAGELAAGAAQLSDGAGALTDGTNEFVTQTETIDQTLREKIEEVTDSLFGGGTATESFVSEKNKDVKSVQFVLKTEPIRKAVPVEEPVPQEETPSFWQKLLRLFGIS